MVGASYVAGASYDVFAARAGHAGGALLTLAVMIAVLVLAGRWFGRHPGGWSALALSMVALIGLATVLVFVMPPVVRFSGLAAADAAVTDWARSQWTSDGYSFALSVASLLHGPHLVLAATLVSLGGWWLDRRRGHRDAAGVLLALGPVLPIAVLNLVLPREGWAAPEALVFPSLAEFDGELPTAAGHALAQVAGGSVAQVGRGCRVAGVAGVPAADHVDAGGRRDDPGRGRRLVGLPGAGRARRSRRCCRGWPGRP